MCIKFTEGYIKVAEINVVEKFINIIKTVTSAEAYVIAQDNALTLRVLVNRFGALEFAIRTLIIQKYENFQKFRQVYYNSFLNFEICLKKLWKFTKDIFPLSRIMKRAVSENIRCRLKEFVV